MAGSAIVKAVIEVKYDDLEKAQLALKKTGVEAVAFGEQAKKAKGGTGGLTQSVGDLSEKLDKGLENSLGRAFKATDRLSSIMGQVTAAAGLVGVAVSAGVAIYNAFAAESQRLAEEQRELAEALKEQAAAELDRAAAAADRAASAYQGLAKSAKVALHALTVDAMLQSGDHAAAIERAKRQQKSVLAEIDAAEWKIQRNEAKAADLESRLNLIRGSEDAHVLSGARKAIEAEQKAAIATAEAAARVVETKREELESANTDLNAAIGRQQTLIDSISTDTFGPEFSPTATTARARTVARDTVNIFAEATDEIAYQWERLPDRIEVALRDWEPLTAWSDSFKPAIADLADALDQDIGGALLSLNAAFEEAAANAKPLDDALASLESTFAASGEAAAAAAFDAIVYGDSFASVLNDFAEQQTKMAVISAAMETAKGIAASFVNPALAESHFAAAAAFAATAAVAGAATVATGGFNGSAGGAGGDGGGGSTDPAVAQSRTGRPAPESGNTQPIIVFEGPVYDSQQAAARALGATMSSAINASGESRGSPRIRAAVIRPGRR